MTNFSKVLKHKRLLYSLTVFCFLALPALFWTSAKTPKGLAENASRTIPVLATVVVPADGGSLGAIPDNNSTGRDVTFSVGGLPSGQTVQSVSIDVTMDHKWSGDLVATLISPGATNMHKIFDESGENPSNLNGTYTFNDTAAGNLCSVAKATANDDDIPAVGYRTRDNACNLTDMNAAFNGLIIPLADPFGKKSKKEQTKKMPANLANGTWTLKVVDDQAGDLGNVTGAQLTINTLGPTAARATISGRVRTPSGQGLRFVWVSLTGDNLTEPLIIPTNQFGYYSFKDIEVGATYVLTVNSKRYIFDNPSRVFTLNQDITDMDFIGNQRGR